MIAWLAGVMVVMAVMGLASCRPDSDDGARGAHPVLHYFTWSDYGGPEVIDAFERETGAKVVVDTFGSNEELLAKLQGGSTGYDVAVPSDFMVSILIRLGLLARLDLEKIPNAALLLDHLQHLPFDPDHRYSLPYLWGTVGIGYDETAMSETPTSWEALWDARYRGRISVLNDQREVFGMALRATGASMNSRKREDIERAKEKLLAQKPLVKTYTSENYDQLLATGDVVLAHGWGGAIARAATLRPTVKYAIPKEGATIWADCLVVLESSKQKDLAMRFIDYLLQAEVAAKTTNRIFFASSNRQAMMQVDPALRSNPAVYPPESAFDRLEWMQDVGDAIRLYDRGWTELKLK